MLYLLIILCIVSFILLNMFKCNILELRPISVPADMKAYKRYSFFSKAIIIAFVVIVIVALAGTVYVCNSDFLTTTEQSNSTYQVTDFNVKRSQYNLIGEYETKYTATVEENFNIEVSDKSIGTEIICNNYNPTTITVEENHYFKWWFLCPYDTYTYTFS